MDRRQKKTRNLIFTAFLELLSQKNVNQITVSEIIEKADIGRATFYAHFETKDYLLKELCEELFCHIFDSTKEGSCNHAHIFECDDKGSIFLHLFSHFKKNDNHIRELICNGDNEVFLSYFKNGLCKLLENRIDFSCKKIPQNLPRDFWINHIASSFIETVRWWNKNKMRETPQQITEYFELAIKTKA